MDPHVEQRLRALRAERDTERLTHGWVLALGLMFVIGLVVGAVLGSYF